MGVLHLPLGAGAWLLPDVGCPPLYEDLDKDAPDVVETQCMHVMDVVSTRMRPQAECVITCSLSRYLCKVPPDECSSLRPVLYPLVELAKQLGGRLRLITIAVLLDVPVARLPAGCDPSSGRIVWPVVECISPASRRPIPPMSMSTPLFGAGPSQPRHRPGAMSGHPPRPCRSRPWPRGFSCLC